MGGDIDGALSVPHSRVLLLTLPTWHTQGKMGPSKYLINYNNKQDARQSPPELTSENISESYLTDCPVYF